MEPIPGPRALPLVGNMLSLRNEEAPLRAVEHLADIYGPVYSLSNGPVRTIMVSSAEILKELMDEKRWIKMPPAALTQGVGVRGLFSARGDDPDWGQAHRILMPAFGPLSIEGMFDGMKDIATQLALKWARRGSDWKFAATDEFTRLTLDTIALCTMNYRFNSFYSDELHPYVDAMLNVLYQNGARSSRPAFMQQIVQLVSSSADTTKDTTLMRKTAQDIITSRRQNPTEEHDFLNTLLYDKDPKTGEAMRDDLIAANMSTFLVAGHETTSGLLSFATYYLLKNPEVYRKAQEEVDQIVGSSSITVDHLKHLKYVEAVLRETSRLCPTAPAISKQINPNCVNETMLLGGKFKIEPSDRIVLLLSRAMQDPTIFGEDAKEFRPERMMDDNPEWTTYQQYWRSFGNGSRSCIGRPFALQEAILALTMVLQNFNLKLDDPSYQLRIKQTLTIKPHGMYIRASLRPGLTATELDHRLHSGDSQAKSKSAKPGKEVHDKSKADKKDLTILYGSNTGTCQALASKLASEATSHGMSASVHAMDDLIGRLPTTHPTVIITASYEGEPPDNALHFVDWMQHLKDQDLAGIKYAVFGCGHSDWQKTFHRIPKLVDDTLSKCGAEKVAKIGVTDCSKENPTGSFEAWCDDTLWPALSVGGGEQNGIVEPEPEATISTGNRAEALRQDVQVGTVKEVKLLTSKGEPEKFHMQVELPEGSFYECGDYLAILPQNPDTVVRKIMSHFSLLADATITLQSPSFAPLPVGTPVSVFELLRNYVELSQPATKRGVSTLAKYTQDEALQQQLHQMSSNDISFEKNVSEPRLSIFGLLQSHRSINIPFPTFLSLLLPLSVRQYSISSSPLSSPTMATITYSVLTSTTSKHNPPPSTLTAPDTDQIFFGVASNYLSTLQSGDKIQVSVRRTAKSTFRLPLDPSTPIIMFCAGTGLAPFRGFIQQRVVQLTNNPHLKLAPALLFVGCRSQTRDRLYADELDEWQRQGAVTVYYAFSQEPEKSDGCKYVADTMTRESEVIAETWRQGARVYVCGSRKFAESVRSATRKMLNAVVEERWRRGDEVGEEFVRELERRVRERAASDIFD